MKAKLPSLTDEQNAEFDRLIKVWQDKLNLMDWRIERGMRPAVGAMASVKTNYGARLATYRTGPGWQNFTPAELEATVVHELLHIVLCELTHLTAASAAADVLESAEHRVVNMLEKLLMGNA